MREVLDGCKICGRPMLTDGSPLVHRTCDACKASQRRKSNRKVAAHRKAERHAAKEEMGAPQCQQCGKTIEGGARLILHQHRPQWVRKFCGDACRQAAFRARNA
jgi:hypothetical protein